MIKIIQEDLESIFVVEKYLFEYLVSCIVRGHPTLRDPLCYFLLLCAISQGLSIPYQFLENRNEQICMQFSGLRSWERAPAWIPFSDSLQWLPLVTFYLKVVYSVMPLLLRIWNIFWPFEDCYLLGFVFAQFFYCLKLPCMKIYEHAVSANKASLFHSRLGSPASFFSSTPVPSLQRQW